MLEQWKTAHPPPPPIAPPAPVVPPPPLTVRIVSIDLTFDEWAILLVKLTLAAIPAAVIVTALLWILGIVIRVALTG